MKITTAVIDSYAARVGSLFKTNPKRREESLQKAHYRRSVEVASIASASSSCPVNKESDRRLTDSADENRLKTQLGKQFTNTNTLNVVSCALGGAYFILPDSPLSFQEAINEFFTNPKQIGSESVYGYALLEGFKGAGGVFISKTPRIEGRDDLEHELYVALNGTNKLRDMGILNYAVVYGGYKCSKAIIDPVTKKVVQQCSKHVKGNVPYTLYENIAPGMAASAYLKKTDSLGAVLLYLQFVLAVATGYEKVGFTHYDAHTDNFIVRDASEMTGSKSAFQLHYNVKGRDYYIPAFYVGTFIDYGMSVIKNPLKDEYIGSPEPELERILVHGDRPHPLHDAYKFLMFSLMQLASRKDKPGTMAYASLSRVFKFFNSTERLEDALSKQWKYRYSLPYVNGFSIYDLLDFMLADDTYARYMTETKNSKLMLLECSKCWTFDKLTQYVSAGGKDVSLVEYYDMYSGKGKGPAYPGYGRARRQYMSKIESLITEGASIVLMDSVPPKSTILTPGVESMCSANQVSIFALLGIIDKVELYLRVGEWFAAQGTYSDLAGTVKAVTLKIRELSAKLCSSITVHKDIIATARSTNGVSGKWFDSTAASDIDLIDQTHYCELASQKKWHVLEEVGSLYPTNRRVKPVGW